MKLFWHTSFWTKHWVTLLHVSRHGSFFRTIKGEKGFFLPDNNIIIIVHIGYITAAAVQLIKTAGYDVTGASSCAVTCFGNVNLESLPRMHSLKCFPANGQKKDQTSGVSMLVSAPSRHIKRVRWCSWLRRKSCWTKADLGLRLWHLEQCEILLAVFLIRSKLWILAQKISHGCLRCRILEKTELSQKGREGVEPFKPLPLLELHPTLKG